MPKSSLQILANQSSVFLIIVFILALSSSAVAQSGHWELLEPINNPTGRFNHDMSSIGRNQVLLFGGMGSLSKKKNDTWIYNLKTNTWDSIPCKNPPSPRWDFSMTQISDTKVLLFGGSTDSFELKNDLWIFDLEQMEWEQIIPEDSTEPRSEHRIVKINDNEVMVFGGNSPLFNTHFPSNDIRIYEIDSNKWIRVKHPLVEPKSRLKFMMTTLKDDYVMLFGGYSPGDAGGYGDNWFFNNQTKKWDSIPSLNKDIFPIRQSEMKLITNDVVLLYGGECQGWDQTSDSWYEGTWIYNNQIKHWFELKLDIYPFGRYGHRMAKIDTNKILMFGGIIKGSNVSRTETWMFVLDSGITSVRVTYSEQEIIISPNPATDYIEISYPPSEKRGSGGVSIFDILGMEITTPSLRATPPYQGGEIRIDVSGLAPGIYYVVIGNLAKKFVKM